MKNEWGGVPLLCINELFKIDGCGYLPRHKERQTLGTRRDVYNLVFFFSIRVDLFRHNGIHPGREAQFVDPEETESELQQQRRDIHTATRAREMQILFVKNPCVWFSLYLSNVMKSTQSGRLNASEGVESYVLQNPPNGDKLWKKSDKRGEVWPER